jgi:multiple sugar transport system permease protein
MSRPAIFTWFAPCKYLTLQRWNHIGHSFLNIFVLILLVIYLFPMVFMLSTALMPLSQVGDRHAPPYPAEQLAIDYSGTRLLLYKVPFASVERQLALLEAGRQESIFVDPANLQGEPITWEGNWRGLTGVYRFHPTLDNFILFFKSLPFGSMVRNTLAAGLVSGVFVMLSSILVAYGFSRFPLPGGDLLFYVLIATMLIPDKVTLVPTYFFFVRVLDWNSSWLPILAPFLFGNAVYIFLLRQNFKSIPRETEEAATLDGAGPLRVLFQIILPQSWPVLITVGLLHFFLRLERDPAGIALLEHCARSDACVLWHPGSSGTHHPATCDSSWSLYRNVRSYFGLAHLAEVFLA